MAAILGLLLWFLLRPKDTSALKVLVLILVFAFEPFSKAVMDWESRNFPLKYDYYLYLIDRSLGISAFQVTRLFTGGQRFFLLWVYQSLAVAMVVWYALNLKIRGGEARRLLVAYLIAYCSGPLLYLIVPGRGPRHAFGAAFPLGSPDVAPVLVKLGGWPNAIPSLHVATAILLVCFSGRNRWVLCAAWVYLAGTVASTLVLEHYVIDLVVAVPFAYFAVLAARGRPGPALASLTLVLGWMLSIRYASPALLASPPLLRMLACLTVAVPGYDLLSAHGAALLARVLPSPEEDRAG